MDSLPPRRVLLPFSLLLVGIAASCGLGCISSAIYSSAQEAIRKSAARTRLAEYLTQALPPSASPKEGRSDRVQVAESADSQLFYDIKATGAFDAAAIERFLARARTYHTDAAYSVTPTMRVAFYDDARTPPVLIATQEVNVVKEMVARIRSVLPPLSTPEADAKLEIWTNIHRTNGIDLTSVVINASITAEEARQIIDAIQPVARESRGPASRFEVDIYRHAPTRTRLARYDSTKDP